MDGKQTQGGLSLLARQSQGGAIARRGFSIQDRYVAQRLPHWLKDRAFTGLMIEGIEDTDVHYADGRVRALQVKSGELNVSELKSMLAVCENRVAHLIANGAFTGFELVARYPNPPVRSCFDALKRLRDGRMEAQPTPIREDTENHWVQKLEELGIGAHRKFIEAYLDPNTNIVDVDDDDGLFRNIAAHLMHLPDCEGHLVESLLAVARELTIAVSRRTNFWSREEIVECLRGFVRDFACAGPRKLIIVRHESLKPVSRDPKAILLPQGLRTMPSEWLDLGPPLSSRPGEEELENAAQGILSRAVPLRGATPRDPDATVLYLGFPHVSLAFLAGYVLGTARPSHVLEHDRDSERFAWSPAADPPEILSEVQCHNGDQARLRISLSAPVEEGLCAVDGNLGIDLHVFLSAPGLGRIKSEESARQAVSAVRHAIEKEVIGKGQRRLHIFAAVPVSVAFLLGRLLSSKTMPCALTYDYVARPEPSYAWNLDLSAADTGGKFVTMID